MCIRDRRGGRGGQAVSRTVEARRQARSPALPPPGGGGTRCRGDFGNRGGLARQGGETRGTSPNISRDPNLQAAPSDVDELGFKPERDTMRYLCLAYGDGKDFHLLAKSEQEKLFDQDELIRKRGGVMGTVRPATTVHSASGKVITRAGPFACLLYTSLRNEHEEPAGTQTDRAVARNRLCRPLEHDFVANCAAVTASYVGLRLSLIHI